MQQLNNKVFCIGLSRTGTTSLHHFFNKLKLKSIHYSPSLFAHPEVVDNSLNFEPTIKKNLIRDWIFRKEWAIPNYNQLEGIFNEYQIFSDAPIPSFFPYLDNKFKNSKFIYTYREEKNWLKSMRWMLENGKVLWNWRDIDFELLNSVYGTYTFDKKKLQQKYRDHHFLVKDYFKGREEDILFINIDKNGIPYHKICSFLGITRPKKIKYINTNQSREVSKTQIALYNSLVSGKKLPGRTL